MVLFGIAGFLGALALFLFGMELMSTSLRKQLGGRLQALLTRATRRPGRGFLLGAAAAALLQSSSAATVLVVGFVSGGLLPLHRAMHLIPGINVGATLTPWLLALGGRRGGDFSPWPFRVLRVFVPVLCLLLAFFFRRRDARKTDFCLALLGFFALLAGMNGMQRAMEPLCRLPQTGELLLCFSHPAAGIPAGALLTAVIQSSAAGLGILQALSTAGHLTYGSAVPLILGQNIGTCTTALLAAARADQNGRRAAVAHLCFNLLGVAVCGGIFYGVNALFPLACMDAPIDALGIAAVHTAFNLVSALLLFPFAALPERLAVMLVPGKSPAGGLFSRHGSVL